MIANRACLVDTLVPRLALVAGLLGLLAGPVAALGQLTLPDGTVRALGEQVVGDERAFLFPRSSVMAAAWLVLPEGSSPVSVTVIGPRGRQRFTFPETNLPRVRHAVWVPRGLWELRLQGLLPRSAGLRLTPQRPRADGQAWISVSPSDLQVDVPPFRAGPGQVAEVDLTHLGDGAWQVEVAGAGERRRFSVAASLSRWTFVPEAWGLEPASVRITGPSPRLSRLLVGQVAEGRPVALDPLSLLAWSDRGPASPPPRWSFWAGTGVLVLLSPDYGYQDRALKRLAFYVEKAPTRGRLLSDTELEGLHGWNAHDYSAEALARFFTEAARGGVALSAEETELRARLTAAGILLAQGGGVWQPGTGALIGISLASPPALRAALLTHEGFHGLYFTSPEFQRGVKTLWDGLPDGARAALRRFLTPAGYDPGDEGLMINEFQAYVLQRPPAEVTPWVRDRVLGGARSAADLSLLGDFEAAARGLNTLVDRLYGLRGGQISWVTSP